MPIHDLSDRNVLANVLIELQVREKASGISWSIQDSDCKSLPNLDVDTERAEKEYCELKIGKTYTLKCESSEEGWKSNYLVIENSVYCMYSESVKIAEITITGNLIGRITFYMSYSLGAGIEIIIIIKFLVIGAKPQQCPADFQKSFNHGRSCCLYNIDGEGKHLRESSTTCWNQAYRLCTVDRCVDNCEISFAFISYL